MKDLQPIEYVATDYRPHLPEVKELNGDNVVEVFLNYRAEYLSTTGVR